MAVIYHTDRQEVEGILDSLRREADAANRDGNQLPLSYATVGRSPPIMKAASCKRCWTRPTIACTKISEPTTLPTTGERPRS